MSTTDETRLQPLRYADGLLGALDIVVKSRAGYDRGVPPFKKRRVGQPRDYLPVLFDFDGPSSRTTVETISTLAHMARFVIADLTDAKSVLQELQAIVPQTPSVAVQPLLLASQQEPGMFDFVRKFPWVLDTHRYVDQRTLLVELKEKVIDPAESKSKELRQKKRNKRRYSRQTAGPQRLKPLE